MKNTNLLKLLERMSSNIIKNQKKLDSNNITTEEYDKEHPNAIDIPENTYLRDKWKNTLGRAFNVAQISTEYSTRLNAEIMQIVDSYERK